MIGSYSLENLIYYKKLFEECDVESFLSKKKLMDQLIISMKSRKSYKNKLRIARKRIKVNAAGIVYLKNTIKKMQEAQKENEYEPERY